MKTHKNRAYQVVTDPKSPLFDVSDFERSCKSKMTYTTPYHALFAIDESIARNPKLRLKYYKCQYCNNYHLTQEI